MSKNSEVPKSVVSELDSYVPRHVRFGVPKCQPAFESYHDVVEQVPLLDAQKRICGYSDKHVKRAPKDTIGKFRYEDFSIDALQSAGVPLEVINVNMKSRSMAEIESAIEKIGSLEELAKSVDEHNSKFDDYFRPSSTQNQDSSSNE